MTVGPVPRMVTARRLRLADASHARCKRLDVGEYAGGETRLGPALFVEPSLHAIDDGGAHDSSVGVTRDSGSLLGRPDAEAHADRQLGVALDALDMHADRFLGRRLGAG